MNFKQLNLVEPILKALNDKGYTTPTPIQGKTIPLILQGKDVLGCAQTGTGKTAAFAIPIIQQISKKPQTKSIKALIVTPTRELAIQIDDNVKDYSRNLPLTHTVIFGGVKQGRQVEELKKGVDILTATPGRLLDLIGQGLLSIDRIEHFVLDEADRMLDMGFIHDIKKIIQLLPAKRQSLFFSATMPDNIVALSRTILDNPVKVEVTPPSSTAETVKQYVYYTNKSEKKNLLLHLLKQGDIDQVLVFSRTKHGADRIVRDLKKKKVDALAIHGDKAQNQRQKALNLFKEGKIQVLVATDIAARGIDIDKLKYVINFDVPNLPETYVHRIGRSGRAGEEGIALSISEPEENAYIKDVEKLTKQKIEVVSDHPFPQTDKPMTAAEKKEWQKEKDRRKQEFFAQRRAKKAAGGNTQGKKKNTPKKKRNNNGPKDGESNQGNAQQKSRPESNDKRNDSNNKKRKSNNKRKSNGNNKSEGGSRRTGTNKKGFPKSLGNKFMWPTLE